MRPVGSRRHRHSRVSLAITTNRIVVSALLQAEATLEDARISFAQAQSAFRPLPEIREVYHALAAAYREAIIAGEAVDRLLPGVMVRQLDHLRTSEQQHLLEVPAGVRLPMCARPNSHAAFGPHYAGMDGDLASPLGPPTRRAWGVDLVAVIDEAARFGRDATGSAGPVGPRRQAALPAGSLGSDVGPAL